MNGQLSARPLAELLREILAKSLSGRLSLEHDRVKVAVYFYQGRFVYAACNLRPFRLREYLRKTGVAPDEMLARFDERITDLQLAKKLVTDHWVTADVMQQVQTRLVSDIIRLASSWTNGAFVIDEHAHLDEAVDLNIDIETLLLEAERRVTAKPVEETAPPDPEPDNVDDFLDRLRRAESYYDILGVETTASAEQLKSTYYKIARRYHPDRFRKAEPALVARIESAFARVTQAYDTLSDEGLRASYNAKLQARKKAQKLADSAPKPTTPAPATPSSPDTTPAEPVISFRERAENDFKEGYAALQQGQRSIATGLFASAARLVPNEPRYRAYYGQMLAAQEHTRRAAETELQAAIKLDPGNAEYRIMLAQLFRDLGFIIRARGEAERAVAADPNNRQARDLLRELKGV